MRYSVQHKKQTRDKILEAASKLFRERGYNGVGVDAVMAEAGLTAGGFYAHFNSKEALFSETFAATMETRTEALRARLKGQTGMDWLLTLINSYLSRTHKNMIADGCPLPALTSDIARSSDVTRVMYEENLRHYLSQIEANMPESSTPKRERALALVAHLLGGVMVARAVSNENLSNEILKASRRAAIAICEGSVEK
jgi:AcrR family transcriptional regulator